MNNTKRSTIKTLTDTLDIIETDPQTGAVVRVRKPSQRVKAIIRQAIETDTLETLYELLKAKAKRN